MEGSNKQPNNLSLVLSLAPEDYLLNKARAAEAKQILTAYEEMNEANRQSHEELTHELEKKIRDGQEASRLLEKMRVQSTVQAAPSMSIQRPFIEYPSSGSRIEEVQDYDAGPGHSQQAYITSNQQMHPYVPQVTVQPAGSSSYQQWTHANVNGQSQLTSDQLYSQYSQQNIMQNSLSRAASYAPFGVRSAVRPQQQSTGQVQGGYDNYLRPMDPTEEQSRLLSRQEPLHYGSTGFNQGQQYTATPPQTIPSQAPTLSNHMVHITRPPKKYAQQSSSTQNPGAGVSQAQAASSGSAYPQDPPPHKTMNIAQPQVNVVAPSSSNSAAIAVGTSWDPISTNPQINPKGNDTPGTTTHTPHLTLIPPTTMPSTHLNPAQYIREFKEAVKNWEVKVPPNSYFDHANTFRVIKDANGATRVAIFHNRQKHTWTGDFDSFCDLWIRHSAFPNVSRNPHFESSSSQMQSAMSMGMHTQGAVPSNAPKPVPSTVPKGIPSTAHKASVQTTSSFQSTTPRPEYPQPSSKQNMPTSTSMHNRGNASRHQAMPSSSQATPSTSATQPAPTSTSMQNRGNALTHQAMPSASQTTPSTSATQHTPTSTSMHNRGNALTHQAMPSASQTLPSTSATELPIWTRFIPPSMRRIPPSVSVPQTPNRQLSTIVNGVTRSAKQADKRFLASHVLFALGKRAREMDSSPTATEPQAKRYAKQGTGVGVSLSANYPSGQAIQAVQKQNIPPQTTPSGSSVVSDSLPQALQHTGMISEELRETLQASEPASSGDQQQQLVNVAPQMSSKIPSTGKAVATASTEIPEASTTFSDQTPLILQNANIIQGEQDVQIPVQPDSQQETFSDNLPVTYSVPQPQSAPSVPLATSSVIVQTSTRPSPVPLTLSSLPPPVVNENTVQPVATSKLPQSSAPAELQRSFIGVPSSASQKQPLFLPSPESSPGMEANDDISIFRTQSGNKVTRSLNLGKSSSSVNKGKNRAYVLVPSRPEYLVKYWQLKKKKRSRALLKGNMMTSRSSVSTSVAGEEDLYNALESHSPSYSLEQQAVQLACSRLQKLSCKWDGCPAKMNSVDALIRHLNGQHKPLSTSHSNSFLCRWTQCGRRCNLHDKHLEKHASLPLNCPYEDCDESFRSAPPLWKHMRTEHEKDRLRPSAQPSYPTLELPDVIPGVIPCYMITTRMVNPDAISSARHAVLGPRVLRNIAGLRKNKPRKTIRDLNGEIIPEEDANKEYEFLNAHPTRYSSNLSQPVEMIQFGDLNSEDISRMVVNEGLTLWGGELDSPGEVSPSVGSREHRSDHDEVEQMLTDSLNSSNL